MSSKQNPEDVREQILHLFSVLEPFSVGDDAVTTACSSLVVLVACMLANTVDADAIQFLTQLPKCFVVFVLDRAAHINLQEEENWHLSVADLLQQPWDFEQIEGGLWAVMEDFWRGADHDDLRWEHETARDGYLLGGQRQWWVDPESPALRPSSPVFRSLLGT